MTVLVPAQQLFQDVGPLSTAARIAAALVFVGIGNNQFGELRPRASASP